jgi:hypothetical protein
LSPGRCHALLFSAGILSGSAHADTGSKQETEADLRERIRELEGRIEEMEAAQPAGPGIRVGPGEIKPRAVGFGGPVDVYGEVEGDAVSLGGDVRLHPGGRIRGDAVALGGEVLLPPGASLHGRPVALDLQEATSRTIPRRLAGWMFGAGIAVALTGWRAGRAQRTWEAMEGRPLQAVFIGLVGTGAGLVGALALAFTLVGLPFALALIGILGLIGSFGAMAIARGLGQRLPLPQKTPDWARTSLGVCFLAGLGQIPFMGWLVLVGWGCAGLGASLISRLGRRGSQDEGR